MKELGLYIHIPFCKSKCLYCDFNSYQNKDDIIEKYIEALIHELSIYSQHNEFKYKTVFLGGGTPTFIHYHYIGSIIKEILPYTIADAEISIECNPGTISKESLLYYRNIGINRLSIGLQAWQSELLQAIGRIHKADDFIDAYNLARTVGFDNISVDLMFSLPNQSQKQWLETLHNVCRLEPEHLSCYSLKLEEGTKLNEMYEKGRLIIPDDEEDRQMYHSTIEILKDYGYTQYEISNFSKENKQCNHNLIYWHNEEYLGTGAGSHSKLNNKRFWNYKNIEHYISSLTDGILPVEGCESINIEEDMWETIFLALRLNKGLDVIKFNKMYNISFEDKYYKVLNKLKADGLIIIHGDTLKLTPLGMDLSNQVFMEFM